MTTEPIITSERVDDIPVLLTQIEHMGVQKLLDKHFPTQGNWQGQSLGQVTVIWLTHILSQADHRLNHVQAWADKRLETLKTFFGDSLGSLDLTDDRLEAVLRYFDHDRNWYSFEKELGIERKVTQTIKIGDNQEISWDERHLVVRSFAITQAESQNLYQRLSKTSDALGQLKIPRRGQKKLTSPEEWESAVDKILKRYRTTGLFQIDIQIERTQKVKRRYLERPPQYFEEIDIDLQFQIDEDAVAQEIQLLGWRVYVTNQINTKLDLKQAVRAYRDEYLIERGFARLKGFPLSLTPIYLQREDHVTGLIRLLSIGLRVLTLLEFQLRRNLNQNSAMASWTLCW